MYSPITSDRVQSAQTFNSTALGAIDGTKQMDREDLVHNLYLSIVN